MASSYFTISRWGDVSLRSFAYGGMEYQAFVGASGDADQIPVRFNYAARRREAILVLAAILATEPILALAVLVFARKGVTQIVNRRSPQGSADQMKGLLHRSGLPTAPAASPSQSRVS